jgi:tetratricopeptide (TPR) repeat protein
MRRHKRYLLAALAGVLVLSCCVPAGRPLLQPDMSQARRYLLVGDFEGAIAAYASIAERYPEDQSVRNEYAAAVEKIKAQADQSFDSRDYSTAESLYSILSTNFPLFQSFQKSLSFGVSLLSQRILECRMNSSERRARQSLASADYQKTLDSYRVLPSEALTDPRVSAGLQRIMEELKRLADTAVARKDFRAAGKGYATLWSGYPLAEQAGLTLSFSKRTLEEGVEKCRSQLTKEGLDQYRKGNLKEAIAIWQDLLEFDPDNGEIKKAVETATEQLEKLKKG